MSNAILIIVLIVFCIFSIKSYMKKLAHGCCGSDSDVIQNVKVRDKDPSHYPCQTVLLVEDMVCKTVQRADRKHADCGRGILSTGQSPGGEGAAAQQTSSGGAGDLLFGQPRGVPRDRGQWKIA